MFYPYRPMKTRVRQSICPYHQKYPGRNYPGCTCSGSITAEVDWEKAREEGYGIFPEMDLPAQHKEVEWEY